MSQKKRNKNNAGGNKPHPGSKWGGARAQVPAQADRIERLVDRDAYGIEYDNVIPLARLKYLFMIGIPIVVLSGIMIGLSIAHLLGKTNNNTNTAMAASVLQTNTPHTLSQTAGKINSEIETNPKPDSNTTVRSNVRNGSVPSIERTVSMAQATNSSDGLFGNSETPSAAVPKSFAPNWPCKSNFQCSTEQYCNFSNGICQVEVPLFEETSEPRMLSVSPLDAAPGDVVIIDGVNLHIEEHRRDRYWVNGGWKIDEQFLMHTVISVGGVDIPQSYWGDPFPERLTFALPEGRQGLVAVTHNDSGFSFQSNHKIRSVGSKGAMVACGLSNPPATGLKAAKPYEIGPYGAGFKDVHVPFPLTRIYYPALCGGVRTPPAKGHFPIAVMLSGNGSTPYNYEFLGKYLASWGFVVINPSTRDPQELKRLYTRHIISANTWLPFLKGRVDASQVVLIGHSRGCERAQNLVAKDDKRIKGFVYMGPFNPTQTLGKTVLFIAAEYDMQGKAPNVRHLWDRQISPRYYINIKGGNHSQFTDSRHWDLVPEDDGKPLISRNQQQEITQTYILTFLQSAMGQQELFPFVLQGQYTPDEVIFESR